MNDKLSYIPDSDMEVLEYYGSIENKNTYNKGFIVSGFIRNFWKFINHTTSNTDNAPKDILQCIDQWLVFSDSWDIHCAKGFEMKHITLNDHISKQHIACKQIHSLDPCTIFGNIIVSKGHKQVWRFRILNECDTIPTILIGIIDIDRIPNINTNLIQKASHQYDITTFGGYGLSTMHGMVYHGRFNAFKFPKWICYPKQLEKNTEIIIELDLSSTRYDSQYQGILRYIIMNENGKKVSDVIIDKQVDLEDQYKLYMTMYGNNDKIALIQP